ncbi:type II secretion system F family protein [Halobacillus litoralis]|nr:type II secretion system F family protein [Halobacillus litoralis]
MPSDSLRNMKSIRFRDPPLSVKHQITFFQRLSHILEKGYPLLDALKMTGWDVALKPTTEAVARSLSKGDTLDAACEKARFSSTVTQFLYFSHIHNDLPKTLKQCKDLLQMKKDYKQRFFQVIRYPLFLFIFLVIAFLILQQTVMPNFVLLFEGQENKALGLMVLMTHALNAIGICSIIFFLSLMCLKFILPHLTLQKKLSFYHRVPLVKFYQSFSLSFLFTTHLYSLLQAGLTLKESMELMKNHKQYEILSFYSEQILSELSEGKSFGEALHSCTLFRTELTDIFHHTNDIKALQDELEMLAAFFMEYMQEKIKAWLQMIQPVFFVCIAVVIISIYASIMLPLYQWMQQI